MGPLDRQFSRRVLGSGFAASAAAMLLARSARAQTLAESGLGGAQWAVNFKATNLYEGPSTDSPFVVELRPLTYLTILGYSDVWAEVYNPRTRTKGYVSSFDLGPSDAPPDYFLAPAPAALESVELPARVLRGAYVSFYPTAAPEAQTYFLQHNAPIHVSDLVEGDDGATWFRTSDGDYLPESTVRVPQPPPVAYEGRWIDAQLGGTTMVTAYEGTTPVMSTLSIRGAGRWQTPQGQFRIQRRVANETMSSETLGIPRNAPDGYHLTNVLYTQYFLGTGESIHYNYWSSVWGYEGSHGCLGMPLAESEFFWNFAGVGTPISIHA
jgi:hypothetical protein